MENSKKFFLALAAVVFLSLIAFAFPPPYIDEAKVSLCNSTGGQPNITIIDPDNQDSRPSLDRAPMALFNCTCPQNTAWNETIGCALKTEPKELGFIARLIAFILRLLGLN